MKNVINWIKSYWGYLFLIVVILFIFLTGVATKCSSKLTATLVEQSEFESWKRQYKDSVNKSYILRENDSIQQRRESDSIKTEYWKSQVSKKQIRIDQLQISANSSKQQAQSAVTTYENDITHTEKCDSAISKLVSHINILQEQNDTLKGAVEDLGNEAEGYSRQLFYCTQQNVNFQKLYEIDQKALIDKEKINEQLRDRLKKNNNWWRRNEKWFYFGAGIITTGLTLKWVTK